MPIVPLQGTRFNVPAHIIRQENETAARAPAVTGRDGFGGGLFRGPGWTSRPNGV